MTSIPNEGLTPIASTDIVKSEISLDKESNTASMVVSWKGRDIKVIVQYDSNKFNETLAAKDLDHALEYKLEILAEKKMLFNKAIKQNLSYSQAKHVLSSQELGTFAICVDPVSKNVVLMFKNFEGDSQELVGIYNQSGYVVDGKLYKELHLLTLEDLYEDQFNRLATHAPNPNKPVSVDYAITPSIMSAEDIAKQSPDNLLNLMGKGVLVSTDQILSAAEKIARILPQAAVKDPAILTTLHKLYDKAAEQLRAGGKIPEAFQVRAIAAEKVAFPSTHPLHDMNLAIEMGSRKQLNRNFGAHFSEMDSGSVKGGNLRAWTRNIDGKMTNCFQFKMSQYARNDFHMILHGIQNNHEAFQASLPGLLKGREVTITAIPHKYRAKNEDGSFSDSPDKCINPHQSQAVQIEFKGIGRLIIGNSIEMGCMINEVNVELDANLLTGEGLKALHQILTVTGCGPVLGAQRKEDEKRLQAAQIFRAFFPREAIRMEQAKEFYELPVEDLIEKIHTNFPEVKKSGIFNKYFIEHPDLMQLQEIYPGRKVWCVGDLAEQLKAKGGVGLMQGVGQNTFDDALNCIVNLMTTGTLSSQDRFWAGAMHTGISSEEDLACGGGDQVFTRLINANLVNEAIDVFLWHGHVQVLWDLSVTNRVSYGYESDTYGAKSLNDDRYILYANRKSLLELTESLEACDNGNELMVKNRIGPEFIQGLVVDSDEKRKQLIARLRQVKGIVKVENGVEYINGIPLDKFIYSSKKFGRHMWDKTLQMPGMVKAIPAEQKKEVPLSSENIDSAIHDELSLDDAYKLMQKAEVGSFLICKRPGHDNHMIFSKGENGISWIIQSDLEDAEYYIQHNPQKYKFPVIKQ